MVRGHLAMCNLGAANHTVLFTVGSLVPTTVPGTWLKPNKYLLGE